MSDLIVARDINPHTSDAHVGIDGGQGMLKVGVTVTDREEEECSGRSNYLSVSISKH